jgi:hypothetical protein
VTTPALFRRRRRHNGREGNRAGRTACRRDASDKIYQVLTEVDVRACRCREVQDVRALLKDPNGFWAEQAKRIHWYRTPGKIKNVSFAPDSVSIKWFEDGVTNVAYNCVDRHLPSAPSSCDHLGRRRPRRTTSDHLSGTA